MKVNDGEWAYIHSTRAGNVVRRHMLMHAALEGSMEAYLDPTPEWISADCGIIVRIKKTDLMLAKKLLESEGLSGFKIF
jgi:hypothetical protein